MEESGEDSAKIENAEGQSSPVGYLGSNGSKGRELLATKCVGYITEFNFFSTPIGQPSMRSEVSKGASQGSNWYVSS